MSDQAGTDRHDPPNNLEAFKVRRDMIVHEDTLISARLTTLLLAQSFLVTAVVLLLANATDCNTQAFHELALMILGLSMFLGLLAHYSISAARLAQEYVRSPAEFYELTFPFRGPHADRWRRCLQSHTVIRRAGFGISLMIPPVTTIVPGVSFFYYCVLRLSDDKCLAAVASLAVLILLIALFLYIHRMFTGDKVVGGQQGA